MTQQNFKPGTVGLFIPCYIDHLWPEAGRATLVLLERLGLHVVFPYEQTCCGQPMANSGCFADARPLARRFVRVFRQFDAIVCPSGSCTAMVRRQYEALAGDVEGFAHVHDHTYELCEYLTDILGIERVEAEFPHRVGLHQSCHGLRELRLGPGSERVVPNRSKVERLLASVRGIELVPLDRADECCGFGGTFAVNEEAVSCRMGSDRLDDHQRHGAEVITATDVSCLMHLDGLARRQGRRLRLLHIAEILAGGASA